MNTLSNINFSIIRNSRRFHAIEIDLSWNGEIHMNFTK